MAIGFSTELNMGIGKLGDVAFKRKYRWVFAVENIGGPTGFSVSGNFVKSGNRPQVDIDETEINFLNGKTFIPGKATFNEISFTYYDVAAPDDPTVGNLLKWVNRVYNFSNVIGTEISATQRSYATQDDGSGYAGTGLLTLLDGCGYAVEQWQLISCWPKSINFGDLDYSSSDECNIELSLRYSYAVYINLCAKTAPEECPSGICSTEAAYFL
jgi:hypothetical protein